MNDLTGPGYATVGGHVHVGPAPPQCDTSRRRDVSASTSISEPIGDNLSARGGVGHTVPGQQRTFDLHVVDVLRPCNSRLRHRRSHRLGRRVDLRHAADFLRAKCAGECSANRQAGVWLGVNDAGRENQEMRRQTTPRCRRTSPWRRDAHLGRRAIQRSGEGILERTYSVGAGEVIDTAVSLRLAEDSPNIPRSNRPGLDQRPEATDIGRMRSGQAKNLAASNGVSNHSSSPAGFAGMRSCRPVDRMGTEIVATPVILDCDPGTDDALAILLALASPELDVLAITVAGGNVGLGHTLRNARALTTLAGSKIPIHAGADRPLLGTFVSETRVHGENGIGGITLPDGAPPAPGLAADIIRRILRDFSQPITLIGIGPATNLALALTTEPALAANVAEIVLMSGAWAEGNVTPAAEFNAWSDPEALAILLRSGRRVVFATLELTAQALVTPGRIAAWRGLGSGRCLQAACDIRAAVPPSPRFDGAPLHDPCAVAWLIRPDLFTTRSCSVRVDLGPGPSRGRTLIDRWGRSGDPLNAVVLETLDAPDFFDLLGRRLAQLP
jgi:inosine-uridine nucleoside N-ribohydrolase